MLRRWSIAIVGALLVPASILVAAPGAAEEPSPDEICAMFPHGQTYRESTGFYQAPAWRYGTTVTVRYLASSCDVTTEGAVTDVAVYGTALIYEGEGIRSASASKDFSFTMTARTARGEEAWPIAWWDCTKTAVDYHWTIAGVYDFALRARDGVWNTTQRSLGPTPLTSSVSISGCTS
jgi:hypothetical protein